MIHDFHFFFISDNKKTDRMNFVIIIFIDFPSNYLHQLTELNNVISDDSHLPIDHINVMNHFSLLFSSCIYIAKKRDAVLQILRFINSWIIKWCSLETLEFPSIIVEKNNVFSVFDFDLVMSESHFWKKVFFFWDLTSLYSLQIEISFGLLSFFKCIPSEWYDDFHNSANLKSNHQ